MPDLLNILLVGIFLPLFPMSMVFNAILDNIKYSWLRVLILFAWPLLGVFIVLNSEFTIPQWLLPLALFTSFLYALRLLTLRDVNQWSGFLGTSFWSLLWLPIIQNVSAQLLYSFAIGLSIPLVLLVMLSAGLEKRFGAAYTDLYGGLARTIPRYAGILVTTIFAAVATPLFPAFFIVLDMIIETVSNQPAAALVLLVIWLLWSWAGARVVQGLIVGRASKVKITDMDVSAVGFYSIILIALMVSGVYLGGVIL